MEKLNYLNVGCGNKYHRQWVNIDMSPKAEEVMAANLLNGIPFPENQFDVVYHSQVLEHFPKEKAHAFMSECHRVLKPGGFLRVVVPDLENIVDEYKKWLNENLENPSEEAAANYEWIMLEMYDQTVRNYSGGQMAEFLERPKVVNEKYVIDRIGHVGRTIRDEYLDNGHSKEPVRSHRSPLSISTYKKAANYILHSLQQKIMPPSQALKIGTFRLGGEIHLWMYDRYSLSKLLRETGFVDIRHKNPFDSDIPNWADYELDVKNGMVYDPTSLFMEARKN